MIHGNPSNKVVVVEAPDAWNFANDVNGVLMQEPLFFVDSTHVDMYMYKAILVKREVANESA